MTQQEPRHPFDEQAALQELEHLQRAIQLTRRRREEALAEFEAFLRDSRDAGGRVPDSVLELANMSRAPGRRLPPSTPARPPDRAPFASVHAPVAAGTPPVAATLDGNGLAESAKSSSSSGPNVAWVGLTSLKLPPAIQSWQGLAAIAGALVVVVLLIVFMRPGGQAEIANESASPASATAPAASEPSATPAPAPPPRALEVTLSTSRPVWLRVTVDGEQAIERQIPANERLHFSADQSVTVRAGDAGAVRLTVNGRDEGPVGGDGQVATRTIPARPAGR